MQQWMQDIIEQPVEKLVERMESVTYDSKDEGLTKGMALKREKELKSFAGMMSGLGIAGGILLSLGLFFTGVGLLSLIGLVFLEYPLGSVSILFRANREKHVHGATKADLQEFKKAGGVEKLDAALKMFYEKHGVKFRKFVNSIEYRERMEQKEQRIKSRLTAEQLERREQRTASLIKKEEERLKKQEEKHLIKRMATKNKKGATTRVAISLEDETLYVDAENKKIFVDDSATKEAEGYCFVEGKTIRVNDNASVAKTRAILFDGSTYYVDENNNVFMDKELKNKCEDLCFDGQEIYFVNTDVLKNN